MMIGSGSRNKIGDRKFLFPCFGEINLSYARYLKDDIMTLAIQVCVHRELGE